MKVKEVKVAPSVSNSLGHCFFPSQVVTPLTKLFRGLCFSLPFLSLLFSCFTLQPTHTHSLSFPQPLLNSTQLNSTYLLPPPPYQLRHKNQTRTPNMRLLTILLCALPALVLGTCPTIADGPPGVDVGGDHGRPSRGPCPLLNALANHCYLPYHGRNLTVNQTAEAFVKGMILRISKGG